MLDTAHELTGIEKASVLLMSMGPVESAKIFEKLSAGERNLLGAEIIKLQHVDSITRQQVFDEVSKRMASNSIDDDAPFRWLEVNTPEQVVKYLAKERASNIALIAAHLTPRFAADMLSHMDNKLRNQVTLRLTSMKPVAKEAVEATEEALRKRIEATAKIPSCMQRRDTLLKMLGGATERVKDSLLGASNHMDAPMCMSVLRSISNPEDMLEMSDTDIQRALAEIQLGDLLLALRVASDELKNCVFRNVSDSVKNILVGELEVSAQIMLKDVDIAQQRVVKVLQAVCGGLSEAAIE